MLPTRWFNVEEIAGDKVLRVYGAILAVTHLLSLAWWLHDGTERLLASGREHICWPLFEGCHAWPYPGRETLQLLLVAYGVLAGASAVLFLLRKELTSIAWALLVLLTAGKAALMVLDFRTRMNQHYMIFFVSLAFLALPHKRTAIRMLIPFFYFWAGTLKLNREWLSGAAIYGEIWPFGPRTLPWACGYVIVMELAIVWGLWSRRTWLFTAAFLQVVVFHLLSYSVVSFFYPALMLGLVSIYPLVRFWGGDSGSLWMQPGLKSAAGLVAFFSVLQVLPHLFPGDTTLTGEGRLFALHMFDARLKCESRAVVHRSGQPDQSIDLYLPLVPRIECDPIVYLSRGKSLCHELLRTAGFEDLDLSLASRRTSDDGALRPVIDSKGFCRRNPSYSLWWTNDWIVK